MTAHSDKALQTLQREVQRLLGRCLLRLQQYERLIKVILAEYEISGPAHALEGVRDARIADTATKTLGTMVGELLGSYVVTKDVDTSIPTETDSSEAAISFRSGLQLSDEDFARTKNGLRELVLLRNNLVHHFIDQHDIGTMDGCRGGRGALIAAYTRIDQHFEELRTWVQAMLDVRRALAEAVQSDAFHDLVVNGIHPDGTVFWPGTGIVRALQEAARELASRVGRPPRRLASGLRSGIQNKCPRSMDATVGGRSCMSRVYSNSAILRWVISALPGIEKKNAPRTQVEFRLQARCI